MNGLLEARHILVPVALGGIAVWMLFPRDEKRPWLLGMVCGLTALLGVVTRFAPPTGEAVRDALFYLFAGGAVISGVMLITDRNPVYAALWFALATLSTCGLFLINSAPFLSAATVIVYAGAIVVTFLFVIMLAQQGGAAAYDRRAFQPVLATIGACVLLASLLYTLETWTAAGEHQFVKPPPTIAANPLSAPQDGDLGSLRGVGRSLFGDYLFAVELAGTVLLIATIGAIALAPRRSQGTL